jgi:TonB family protein
MLSNKRSLTAAIAILVLAFSIHAQITARDEGMQAYNSGDYAKAVNLLKAVTSQNKGDAEAWNILGTSYFHLDRVREATNAFEKSVDADPKNATAHANLAIVYLLRNKSKGEEMARDTLKLDPKSAGANFVLGAFAYRKQEYGAAYNYARRAVQSDPTRADAYMLIYKSLVASFIGLNSKAVAPAARAEIITNAVSAFQKYYDLIPADQQKPLDKQLADLNFFKEYYGRPEMQQPLDADRPAGPEPGTEPLKILNTPKANFTNGARERNVNGTVLLMVGFQADGKIGPVMLLKSLDKELDQNAMAAARKITFTPELKNGVPVPVVKQIEYSFSLH